MALGPGWVISAPLRASTISWGNFVLARWEDEDTLRAVVFNGDSNILLDEFQKPRKRGRIAKAHAPKLVALYDPNAALQRQDDIEEADQHGITLAALLQERRAT